MKRFVAKLILKLALLKKPLLTFYASKWLKLMIEKYPNEVDDVFMKVGVLPVLDYYYQPMINPKKHLYKSLREDRDLPGIDFNTEEQLSLLRNFNYNNELLNFPIDQKEEIEFYYNNGSYGSGDAEYLYNMIRHFKPSKIIEIGSGSSTLMALNAINQNKKEDNKYKCQHICIEPYEQPFLEKIGVQLIREKVETFDKSFFQILEENDILFIDSSHIIRPQGDVLYIYLNILPTLKPGVLVHVHDIFMPKDYLDEWIYDHILFNEQYLLEAFLTFNPNFKIIGALNYLSHNYQKEFASVCPIFAKQQNREPGGFWMVKL